jgi:6-phosphogluconolactonase
MQLTFFSLGTVLLSILLLGVTSPSVVAADKANPNDLWVFVGTYTGKNSKGIYVSRLDRSAGALGPVTLAAEIASPSFLAIHPNSRFLYAVNEVADFSGKNSGAVTAFSIDRATGKLQMLNQQSSGGAGPCHLVVDKAGKNVLIANYSGGSVAAFPLQADGKLGTASAFIQHTGSSVNPQRQKEPHAHSINLDAANRYAFAADLGLDKILIYDFDPARGTLKPHAPAFAAVKGGAGPRHFAFNPNGRYAYVINEMQMTLTAFDYADGKLTERQTLSTLPAGAGEDPGFSTAEVQVHPTGKFVYGSNRGHDSIVVYEVGANGDLKWVENVNTRGKTPRNFGVEPKGEFLIAANQNSNSLAVFRIDARTGKLSPVGEPLPAPSPVCVKFLPVE